jgi:ATPase subunit of ABC transporter with duplicated ATPase domains
MLQVQGLDYTIGERQLLKSIDWAVHPGKRVALIGPNGAGKTTLFRLVIGELTPLSGKIVKPKSYVIGYLPQRKKAWREGPYCRRRSRAAEICWTWRKGSQSCTWRWMGRMKTTTSC